MTELTVGFWNIEKGNSDFDGDDYALRNRQRETRFVFVQNAVFEWFRHSRAPFDVLVLAELTVLQGEGDFFMRMLATTLNNHIGAEHFRSKFYFSYVGAAGTRIGTCNFGILWNSAHPALRGIDNDIKPVMEPTWVRPMIVIPARGLTIVGAHVKSGNHARAYEEIADMLHRIVDDLDGYGVLIGDMNIDFGQLPGRYGLRERGIHMTPVNPGQNPTHRSRSPLFPPATLDYLWHEESRSQCEAHPPDPGYEAWQVIDHAPIQYHIQTT